MSSDPAALCALLRKHPEQHKYDHGHALVLSGGVGRGGAARLAARAALRVGAGLVTLACPPAALLENAARLDAVMVRALRDGAALAEMLGDPRLSALCLGPGLGLGARAAELVAVALDQRDQARAVVLDADALTLISQDPALRAGLHASCILTPHEGEFARLFPDLAGALQGSVRAQAVAEAALRVRAHVLLKGALTLIAAPNGDLLSHDARGARAAPWLATAGSGDVLAGLIAGLLARGVPVAQAAEAAVFLHVEAARSIGPGLIAEDLPEAIPSVLRVLGC
ncbi:MAG: NAD(P)H-hydrate dehydratase [Roseinatronobacter sp.]